MKLKQKFISFVFQPCCCFCNQSIIHTNRDSNFESSQIVCDDCYDDILNTNMDRCYFCGTETTPLNPFGSRCSACRKWEGKFERVVAIGKYRDLLRQSILDIKRDSNETKAYQLGVLLGDLSGKLDLPVNLDYVVPVPTHWRRRLSRHGLHVSDTMAEGFCRISGMKKKRNLLKCIRLTEKQSKLRPSQRIKNVRGAYRVNPKFDVSDLRILLLDDVMTSGATINECTRVLLRAGARDVFVAVAARATGVS